LSTVVKYRDCGHWSLGLCSWPKAALQLSVRWEITPACRNEGNDAALPQPLAVLGRHQQHKDPSFPQMVVLRWGTSTIGSPYCPEALTVGYCLFMDLGLWEKEWEGCAGGPWSKVERCCQLRALRKGPTQWHLGREADVLCCAAWLPGVRSLLTCSSDHDHRVLAALSQGWGWQLP
jgi:hypothetical protein